MDLKLFISTFLLIFLAELGDKTQLTAMARAAGTDGAKWTVFAAAGSALLLSTLLAITFGRFLSRVVPDHVVRILAGLLFLLFGIMLLAGALTRSPTAVPAEGKLSSPTDGVMMRAILRIAADFEEASAADYATLAANSADTRTQKLLLEIEAEEHEHLRMMREIGSDHEKVHVKHLSLTDLPSGEDLQHDVAQSDRPILTHALEHEHATAQFYRELAHRTPIPALQRTFQYLAQAEEDHIRRINALLAS